MTSKDGVLPSAEGLLASKDDVLPSAEGLLSSKDGGLPSAEGLLSSKDAGLRDESSSSAFVEGVWIQSRHRPARPNVLNGINPLN